MGGYECSVPPDGPDDYLINARAQRQRAVLHRVMIVHLEVARAPQRNVHLGMFRQRRQHVVIKAEAGGDLRDAGAVQHHRARDLGLLRRARHGRGARGALARGAARRGRGRGRRRGRGRGRGRGRLEAAQLAQLLEVDQHARRARLIERDWSDEKIKGVQNRR
jgi:hypothetical protein